MKFEIKFNAYTHDIPSRHTNLLTMMWRNAGRYKTSTDVVDVADVVDVPDVVDAVVVDAVVVEENDPCTQTISRRTQSFGNVLPNDCVLHEIVCDESNTRDISSVRIC